MKQEVWYNSGSVSSGNLPAKKVDFDTIEKRFGIKLPNVLVELFRIQNGGRTSFKTYTLPDNEFLELEDFVTLKEIGEECDFGFEKDDWNRLIRRTSKLIVIARHGYDTFLCLDYRSSTDEPSVTLIDAVLEPKEKVHYATFQSFIEHLQQETT